MILIIGAGVTGLTCASCLNGDILVIEKDKKVGGYCQTTKRNGFTWDRAGHFFHFKNKNIESFFKKNIPNKSFVNLEKKTSIYLEKIGVIDFPFQKNIHQLPKEHYIKCLIDLYCAEKTQKPYYTFKEFLYNRLGKSISELFLIPYNEKLYACDLDNLDHDAMGRFFPEVSFEDVLFNADVSNNNSYNNYFSYPTGGAEQFISVIEKSAKKNTDIFLETSVVSIDIYNKLATLSDGSNVKYDLLLNTTPLDSFCKLININVDSSILTSNKVAVFNIGFDSKIDSGFHWIYFPGNEVFYRVGCYHNILGDKRASFYVEIGLSKDDTSAESELLEKVLKDLNKVGLIDETMNIIDYEYIVMNPAYVHINKNSENFKINLKNKLKDHSIYSAGRYGSWTYCSIEDNMIEAFYLAKKFSAINPNYNFINLFNEKVNSNEIEELEKKIA